MPDAAAERVGAGKYACSEYDLYFYAGGASLYGVESPDYCSALGLTGVASFADSEVAIDVAEAYTPEEVADDYVAAVAGMDAADASSLAVSGSGKICGADARWPG